MADDQSDVRAPTRPRSALRDPPKSDHDRTLCDRCGADVYRMHTVWRCPKCGFKSDCCGW